jgi:adenylate cyclase
MTIRSDRMIPLSLEQLSNFIRGISVRQVRLACGLVLFAYLVSHFLNHALGNISMDALAAGVWYHTAFWQFLPVAITFYAAVLVHTGLGIWALYDRAAPARARPEHPRAHHHPHRRRAARPHPFRA